MSATRVQSGFAVELFCCSGGMAEGFRRAGIVFDVAIDADPNACASYAANLGRTPVQAGAAAWLAAEGDALRGRVDLLVADPPCTPWSRAGKRRGTEDERDCLLVTCEAIRRIRPRTWLVANVPGLDDAPNWPTVQRTIGALAECGYCVDFVKTGGGTSEGRQEVKQRQVDWKRRARTRLREIRELRCRYGRVL